MEIQVLQSYFKGQVNHFSTFKYVYKSAYVEKVQCYTIYVCCNKFKTVNQCESRCEVTERKRNIKQNSLKVRDLGNIL